MKQHLRKWLESGPWWIPPFAWVVVGAVAMLNLVQLVDAAATLRQSRAAQAIWYALGLQNVHGALLVLLLVVTCVAHWPPRRRPSR